MKKVLKRTNQVFSDELNEDSLFLLNENGKDYFLNKTSNGSFEWTDLGSRQNAGNSFSSFDEAIDYATEDNKTLMVFESRRGLLTALHARTEQKLQAMLS